MAQSPAESAPMVDLATWTDGRRQAILEAIEFYDGEAHTLEIRDYGDVPRGSFNHHVDLLLAPPENVRNGIDWVDGGLIEQTGEVEIGMPSPARQFGLTDAGRRVLDEVTDSPGVSADDVRDLKQQAEDLEERNAALEGRVEDLEQENAALKERYNHMADVVEGLVGDDGSSLSR